MWGRQLAVAVVAVASAGCASPTGMSEEYDARPSVAPGSPTPAPRPAQPNPAQPNLATAQSDRPRGVPRVAQRVRVVWVSDGDTVGLVARRNGPALRANRRTPVRLLEIDSPESGRPDTPEQCFADRATARVTRLLAVGSTAWAVRDRELRDRFDRTLLYVWNRRGVFVNRALVRGGFAKAVLFEPNDRYIATLRAAERDARDRRRGLWGACAYFGAPR